MSDETKAPNGAETEAILEPTPEAAETSEPVTSPVEADATTSDAPETTPEPEAPVAEAIAPEPTPAPEPVAATPSAVEPTTSVEDDASLFEAALAEMEESGQTSEQNYRRLNKGDRITATVIQVERDRVFVDLGTKSEGVIPLAELSEENLDSAQGHLQVGDKVNVVVIRPEGTDGNPIVSKKRADFDQKWVDIETKFESKEAFMAQVVDRVKGGLVVDIGVRGFVPATHVGSGKLRNIEKYVGQSIALKIIEIDRERKKVVLSNRLAEEERREEVKTQIFDKVQPGQILTGTVRRLTDYGAFVDLGGVDGLLHISEMSWVRINHPKEVLKEGEEIQVMVLRLDPDLGKISLGLRQVLPDPWNLIRENYKLGQKIQCKISRIVQSGAFVRLPEGAEAFLPISEMANRRIGKPTDVIEENQDVEVTIIDLRPDERRMVLSLRGGTPGERRSGFGGTNYPEPSEYEDMRAGRRTGPGGAAGGKKRKGRRGRDDEYEDVPVTGRVPTGGATIGERLGLLKGFMTREEEPEEDAKPAASETEEQE